MELTALERAEQLQRRKWIYEQKFPQTKKGGIPNQSVNISFSNDAADKTGQTARTVQADVAIAKGIPAKIRDEIRGTDMEDNREELRLLARAKADPAAQKKAVAAVKSGEAKNLRAALKPPLS